jgi:hypothetical protein
MKSKKSIVKKALKGKETIAEEKSEAKLVAKKYPNLKKK